MSSVDVAGILYMGLTLGIVYIIVFNDGIVNIAAQGQLKPRHWLSELDMVHPHPRQNDHTPLFE